MAPGQIHVAYHNRLWIPAIGISIALGKIFFSNNFIHLAIYEISFLLFYWIGENIVSCDLDLISISGQDGRAITFGKKDISDKLQKKIGFLSKIIGYLIGIIPFMFSQWSAFYSYSMQFLGGHRNPFSHSLVLSTILRMIWFDVVFYLMANQIYATGISSWHWTGSMYFNLYMDVWLVPILAGQFAAWSITDATHLLLDTEWAKGKLYNPITTKKKEINNGI
jgi:hypothetical protein